MRQRSGFTLVELLIVIAIISMLLGMVMPSLGRARELARRAVCRKNLHSIGQAMYAYATAWMAYPDMYPDKGGAYMVGAGVTGAGGVPGAEAHATRKSKATIPASVPNTALNRTIRVRLIFRLPIPSPRGWARQVKTTCCEKSNTTVL